MNQKPNVHRPTFIIAEAGVNHNGDTALALALVDVAVSCGADAVKFQTFNADRLVRRGANKADYQRNQTGAGDQHSMLRKLEMSEDVHHALEQHCAKAGIEFMSTPFDEVAADFLVELGMRRIKIPSGEITNHPFLGHLASKGLPLILSTGMATLAEVQEAVSVISETRKASGHLNPLAESLTILHCTSNYPALASDVNLRAMATLGEATGLPVGYSDHTAGIAVATAAVAMGACVIEKHFTLDSNLPGPDHKASLEPDALKAMVSQIREVEAALGSTEKSPTSSELPVRELVRRSVTLACDVTEGQLLSKENLTLLRPGNGIAPKALPQVIGLRARRDMPAGHTLSWDDIA
jgi:N,N'-diacetyllegionaminate synthase